MKNRILTKTSLVIWNEPNENPKHKFAVHFSEEKVKSGNRISNAILQVHTYFFINFQIDFSYLLQNQTIDRILIVSLSLRWVRFSKAMSANTATSPTVYPRNCRPLPFSMEVIVSYALILILFVYVNSWICAIRSVVLAVKCHLKSYDQCLFLCPMCFLMEFLFVE